MNTGGISNIFSDKPDEFRPSSRVLARPGGETSQIFGDGEIKGANPNRRDPNQPSNNPVEHVFGKKQFSGHNETSFSLYDTDSVNETHVARRDPNARSDTVE